MFFLKELPTRQVLERYGREHPAMRVDEVEEALHMLRRASLLLRRLDAYFASRDFSLARFLVLIVLDREDDDVGLRISDIAERIDVARPVMTRTLQALVTERLISVRDSNSDGRSRHVKLTAKGAERLQQMLPGYYETIHAFMQQRTEPT